METGPSNEKRTRRRALEKRKITVFHAGNLTHIMGPEISIFLLRLKSISFVEKFQLRSDQVKFFILELVPSLRNKFSFIWSTNNEVVTFDMSSGEGRCDKCLADTNSGK
jgi:hypothetical protein